MGKRNVSEGSPSLRRKVSSVFVAAAVAVSLVPAPAFADSYAASSLDRGAAITVQAEKGTQAASLNTQVAKKTVKHCGFTTSTKKIEKNATTVKKGTTRLTVKKKEGYVKFKATKTKTWSFKFSDLKDKKDTSVGFVSIQLRDDAKYSFLKKAATKGGKNDFIQLTANGHKDSWGKGANKGLASRTAKMKLKKGQIVYFQPWMPGKGDLTLTMKIS